MDDIIDESHGPGQSHGSQGSEEGSHESHGSHGSEPLAPPPTHAAEGAPRGPLVRPFELFLIAGVVIFDQLTKLTVRVTLPLHESRRIIPSLLDFTHVQNTGAAFGLLNAADFPYKSAVMIVIAALAGAGREGVQPILGHVRVKRAEIDREELVQRLEDRRIVVPLVGAEHRRRGRSVPAEREAIDLLQLCRCQAIR